MLDLNTIGKLFIKRIEKSNKKNSIGWIENSEIKFYTYEQYHYVVKSLVAAYQHYGISKGEKISLLGQTCKEWHLYDLAALVSGITIVPIYPTYTASEIEFLYNHSESSVMILDGEEHAERVLKVISKFNTLKMVLTFVDLPQETLNKFPKDLTICTFKEMLAKGNDVLKKTNFSLEEVINKVNETDLASIIYTSGTTGEPKGAMITHFGLTRMLENVRAGFFGVFNENDRSLSFLPLSHVLGRADSFIPLVFGGEMVFSRGLDKVIDDLPIAKPTVVTAVPRIFEKIYERIQQKLNSESIVKQKLFEWANKVSTEYYNKIQNDLIPTPKELISKTIAYKLVFSKIYEKFGGRIRFFVSGGAPLSVEIILFLRNANLCILEGYGLTETIAPFTVNPAYKQIPGTVGVPLGNGQIRFAPDGEILLKSDAMFIGYYKNQVETDKVLKDGWFYTGDIGELSPDGYLKITDRKKDIIITSGGKNIAPQKIENLLKNKPFISEAMIVGDRRKYLTAIIGIEKKNFIGPLKEMEIPKDCSVADLANNPKVYEIIEKNIIEVNKELPKHESIKHFIIAPEEFSVDNGLLTPSLKLKKKVVLKRYEEEINAMYSST